MTAETAPATPPRFDDLLEKLRGLVDKLESGNLTLEDSLRCFEEGMRICRAGAGVLDQAERRVEILLAGPDGGLKTAAFGNPGDNE